MRHLSIVLMATRVHFNLDLMTTSVAFKVRSKPKNLVTFKNINMQAKYKIPVK